MASSLCVLCQQFNRDEGELCCLCHRWIEELKAESGVTEISLAAIKRLLPRTSQQPQVSVRRLADFTHLAEVTLIQFCERNHIPLIRSRNDQSFYYLSRANILRVLRMVDDPLYLRTLPCRIPTCPNQTREGTNFSLCPSHLQSLAAIINSSERVTWGDYRSLADQSFFTHEQIARLLGTSRSSVGIWIRTGKIRADQKPYRSLVESSEVWRLIGQMLDTIRLYQFRTMTGLSKMQLAHFLACQSCRVEPQSLSLYGERAFSREQLPELLAQLEMHRQHIANARAWQTRLAADESNMKMLARRFGVVTKTVHQAVVSGELKPSKVFVTQRCFPENEVQAWIDRLERGESVLGPQSRAKILMIARTERAKKATPAER